MPVQDLKTNDKYDYCVVLQDPKSGLDVEVFLTLDWPGSAYWSGGRYEPWSLEIVDDPTFEVGDAILCDGEDTIYTLTQKQISKAIQKATEQYWGNYSDTNE